MPLTNKDANKYLNDLVEGKAKVEAQVEVTALGQFKKLSAQIEKLGQQSTQLMERLQQLRNEVVRLNGQREAYATILCESEAVRRGMPPMSMEENVTEVTKEELESKLGGKVTEVPAPKVVPLRSGKTKRR